MITHGRSSEDESDFISEYDCDSQKHVVNGTVVDKVTVELSQHDNAGQE